MHCAAQELHYHVVSDHRRISPCSTSRRTTSLRSCTTMWSLTIGGARPSNDSAGDRRISPSLGIVMLGAVRSRQSKLSTVEENATECLSLPSRAGTFSSSLLPVCMKHCRRSEDDSCVENRHVPDESWVGSADEVLLRSQRHPFPRGAGLDRATLAWLTVGKTRPTV